MSAWEHDGRKPINLMRFKSIRKYHKHREVGKHIHFIVPEEDYYRYYLSWLSNNPRWFLDEKYIILV